MIGRLWYMRVAIIDADLIGRKKHRFPNLASMKIAGYYKEKGDMVELKLDYKDLDQYDEVYISKVFTDTPFPKGIKPTNRIHLGGTGFYFDKAKNLPEQIEHHMPDYQLYDKWIESEVAKAKDEAERVGETFDKKRFMKQFKGYTDYSIGFLTRGCFRKCEFCVNKKYDHVFVHSPLDEFFSKERRKICLLDDNFLGASNAKEILEEIKLKNKSFTFKQGLDERLLTDAKCEMLFSSQYDGDYTFAFDKISDYPLIEEKLKMIRTHTDAKKIKFYVLVGFESTDETDIENAFKRIELLFRYQCLPYIMRYQNQNESPWKNSEFKGMYISLARWANQPNLIKKMSFREFCERNQALKKTAGLCSTMQSMREFEERFPVVAEKYFDIRYETYKL